MEFREVVSIAQEVAEQVMEDFVDTKECPECRDSRTMLAVRSYDDECVRWRCLGCLKLFTEGLTEC